MPKKQDIKKHSNAINFNNFLIVLHAPLPLRSPLGNSHLDIFAKTQTSEQWTLTLEDRGWRNTATCQQGGKPCEERMLREYWLPGKQRMPKRQTQHGCEEDKSQLQLTEIEKWRNESHQHPNRSPADIVATMQI